MLLLIIVEKRLFRRVCLEASPRLQFLLKIAILADLLWKRLSVENVEFDVDKRGEEMRREEMMIGSRKC